MADVRALPINPVGSLSAIAGAGPPAGFTTGQLYPVVAIAVDSAVTPPVGYLVTIDNNGALKAVQASAFTFTYEKAF